MRLFVFTCLAFLLTYSSKAQEKWTLQVPNSPETVDFVKIPAGKVMLGSTEKKAESDEAPILELDLDSFWMASTETTIELFAVYPGS